MKYLLLKKVCIENDLGGTEILPKGKYKIIVTKQWDDYECGIRGIGTLVNKKDIEVSRKAGTTIYTPKKKFHPETVYWSEFDIIERKRKI
jgi:hypothetical protein